MKSTITIAALLFCLPGAARPATVEFQRLDPITNQPIGPGEMVEISPEDERARPRPSPRRLRRTIGLAALGKKAVVRVADPTSNWMGTGWLVSLDTRVLVVTNAHVLAHMHLDSLRVETMNGERLPVQGARSWNEEDDYAILEVAPVTVGLLFRCLHLSPTAPQEGEHVVVIGNPLGVEGVITEGMISAIRSRDLLISAPISPGSSGSPVLNLQGQVVGMVKASLTVGQNMNLAVPIEQLHYVLQKELDGAPIKVSAHEPVPAPTPHRQRAHRGRNPPATSHLEADGPTQSSRP
jgi:S1-C subfamily serine protease